MASRDGASPAVSLRVVIPCDMAGFHDSGRGVRRRLSVRPVSAVLLPPWLRFPAAHGRRRFPARVGAPVFVQSFREQRAAWCTARARQEALVLATFCAQTGLNALISVRASHRDDLLSSSKSNRSGASRYGLGGAENDSGQSAPPLAPGLGSAWVALSSSMESRYWTMASTWRSTSLGSLSSRKFGASA